MLLFSSPHLRTLGGAGTLRAFRLGHLLWVVSGIVQLSILRNGNKKVHYGSFM